MHRDPSGKLTVEIYVTDQHEKERIVWNHRKPFLKILFQKGWAHQSYVEICGMGHLAFFCGCQESRLIQCCLEWFCQCLVIKCSLFKNCFIRSTWSKNLTAMTLSFTKIFQSLFNKSFLLLCYQWLTRKPWIQLYSIDFLPKGLISSRDLLCQ